MVSDKQCRVRIRSSECWSRDWKVGSGEGFVGYGRSWQVSMSFTIAISSSSSVSGRQETAGNPETVGVNRKEWVRVCKVRAWWTRFAATEF